MRTKSASRGVALVAAAAAATLVTSACGDSGDTADETDTGAAETVDEATAEAGGDVVVVSTTTPLGDVVRRVVECGGGTAETLMPVGTDPHDFSPSSAQVAGLVDASLVVSNGLGLEEGLEDALESAAADRATVLEVAPLLDPIEFAGGSHDEEHSDEEHSDEEHAHEHGSEDPHVWHDVARMATAAELVGAELAEVTGDEAYASCGTEVSEELTEVDAEVRSILDAVPADQRVLVTDHDAFGYLADAYDFEVAGVVIPGGSTLSDPSSAELAELVETVEAEGVPAIFSNTATSSELVEAVAAETDTEVAVVELYVGSLGEPGSGAETYDEMVRTNAERISDALAG